MISELLPMNPVAREVSSLLKSSSVWSPESGGLADKDREGGGSEPVFRAVFGSPAAATDAFESSVRFGADS